MFAGAGAGAGQVSVAVLVLVLVLCFGFYAVDLDLPEHLICFLKSTVDRSIRHGWRIERSRTGSAICATFRRMISKNAVGTRRAKRLRKDFWLLFIGKVTRRAMEWLRKNRRERFFTSALARSPKGESQDGTNKPAMDGEHRGQARAAS